MIKVLHGSPSEQFPTSRLGLPTVQRTIADTTPIPLNNCANRNKSSNIARNVQTNFGFTQKKSVSPAAKISTQTNIINQFKSPASANNNSNNLSFIEPVHAKAMPSLENVKITTEVNCSVDNQKGNLRSVSCVSRGPSTPNSINNSTRFDDARHLPVLFGRKVTPDLTPRLDSRRAVPLRVPANNNDSRCFESEGSVRDKKVTFSSPNIDLHNSSQLLNFEGVNISINDLLFLKQLKEQGNITDMKSYLDGHNAAGKSSFSFVKSETGIRGTKQPDNFGFVSHRKLISPESLHRLANFFKKVIVYSAKIESIKAEMFQSRHGLEVENIFQLYNESNRDFLSKFEIAKLFSDIGLKIEAEDAEKLILYINRVESHAGGLGVYQTNMSFEVFCRFFCSRSENWGQRKSSLSSNASRRLSSPHEVQIAAADFHSMK